MARAVTAWLVKHNDEYAAIVDGKIEWVSDVKLALRLSRRADAKNLAWFLGPKGKPFENVFG